MYELLIIKVHATNNFSRVVKEKLLSAHAGSSISLCLPLPPSLPVLLSFSNARGNWVTCERAAPD